MGQGKIHVGVGGWTFAPWRGTFFPAGLPHARELEHASRQITAIEINGTYYRTQAPASFAKWRDATPPGFVFTVKASRYCTNRTKLAEAGESIARFIGSGLTELGDKLGPILWQLMPTKQFDAADCEAFLALLPASHGGLPLRHAIEPRHDSFRDAAFIALARRHDVAIVFADSARHPEIDAPTAGFTYARLQQSREEVATGYDDAALDRWADRARGWAADGRDAFVFFISGAKVRAPAAAQALIARLGQER